VKSRSHSWLVVVALAALGLAGVQATLYLSYFYTPTQITPGTLWVVTPDGGAPVSLYESYRIFFIHLPSAYATATCCGLTALGGVMLLLTRKPQWESLVVSAAEGGLAFGALVLLTGTLWADFAWGSGRLGSGWNWEPRLTTMLILWLAFAALLVVRRALGQAQSRAQVTQITAVYGILLGPLYPLVSKAVEIGRIAHPLSFKDQLSAPEVALTQRVAGLGVLVALVALVALRYQWNELGRQIELERAA
jgi:ABC-type transport system involved in cytochrome c biogenesis permease subunit